MKPEKRDGGIMNCYIEGNELITDKRKIMANCLNLLGVF
jgi:hypothetical protein